MAFRNFNEQNNRPTPSVSEAACPQMMPLSLELLPPVLCQSFGVPMNDSQFMQRGMLGFSVQNALRQRADMDLLRYGQAEQLPGQYMAPNQQMHYSVGSLAPYGQMPQLGYGLGAPGSVDPQSYAHRMMHYGNMQCGPNMQQNSQSADIAAPPMQQPGAPSRGVKRVADPHATATPTADSMEPVKRSRLVWTRDLHMRFEAAVEKAGGIDVAVPKTVLEHMAVAGLTRDNVASHLQKHRMHVKKNKEITESQAAAPGSQAQSTQELTTTSATAGRPLQRSSTECEASGAISLGAMNGIDSRAAANEGQTSGAAKGDASASAHFTSDSGSRKTAFAMPMRSGVNSTPESRDTCTGSDKAVNAALGSNMTSSMCQMAGPQARVPPHGSLPADMARAAPFAPPAPTAAAPQPPAAADVAAPR